MKETRKFFDNNRLNKGHSRMPGQKPHNISPVPGHYNHVLPPLDILAEYEEMHPGTLTKIILMAEKEQAHRHLLELQNIKKSNKAIMTGRIFSLALVLVIASATIILAFGGLYVVAAVFSVVAFSAIGLVSFVCSGKDSRRRPFNKNFEQRHRSPNYKPKPARALQGQ